MQENEQNAALQDKMEFIKKMWNEFSIDFDVFQQKYWALGGWEVVRAGLPGGFDPLAFSAGSQGD